ncbi:diguanylate cyclase [Bacillus sp. MUM 13]|uniref:histidine kinase N-terminal 7TM domain-containing diguanylate cyclase n=1 Tax=Bacillus sp. MUM 13 TaxID=1678001 RepID=UPI0008F5BD3E|nr:diguanylate cyclase [Bacillus sp. MUM 13]OIK12635.1 hypothetical protein BIV59_08065 [Bacillus sp. MUM 13]
MFIPVHFPVSTFFSFLLFTFLAIFAFRFRQRVGGMYLLITLCLSAILSISSVFELMSVSIQDKIFWRNVEQIPLLTSSLVLYGAVLELIGRDKAKVKVHVAILSIPLCIYLMLIFTDPLHHLMRAHISLSSFGELKRLNIVSTRLSMCFILYSRIIAVILAITLIRNLKKVSAYNRKQFYMIFLATIIPFILTLLKQFAGLNISSSASSIPAGILIFYSIVQHKLLINSPIAKERIIENLSEAIIVLNQDEMIIELNPAADKMINSLISEGQGTLIGKDIKTILKNDKELIDSITGESSGKREIELSKRHYSLKIIPVQISKGELYKILIFTDLTDHISYEKQLYERATTDYLTKVYNRQYLTEIAHQKITELEGTDGSVSLIILDIDHFKVINDTYGHQSGDRVLEKIGQILTNLMSANGIVCRIGGEEFAILLPDSSEKHAYQIAEKIRNYISHSKININDDHSVSLTVSIGLKSISDSKITFKELYAEADKALYLSKENGRNQTNIA